MTPSWGPVQGFLLISLGWGLGRNTAGYLLITAYHHDLVLSLLSLSPEEGDTASSLPHEVTVSPHS